MFSCRPRMLRFIAAGMAVLLLTLVAVPVAAQETETYESEFFPLSLTYDTEIWGSRSTSSFNTNEQVQLRSGATVFFLQAFESGGDDADECIASAIESVERVETVENVEETDEFPLPDGPRGGEEVVLTYDISLDGRENPVSMIQYVSCVELDEESLLLVGVETRAGIYEEELEIIDGILAGLEIDD
jgi:hypothetical protein